jgi:hypothetical protein
MLTHHCHGKFRDIGFVFESHIIGKNQVTMYCAG